MTTVAAAIAAVEEAERIAQERTEKNSPLYRRQVAELELTWAKMRLETALAKAGIEAPAPAPKPLMPVGTPAPFIPDRDRELAGYMACNRCAVARLAEELAADEPWATDEPLPDLSHLWRTSNAVRTRPRESSNDGKPHHDRYSAWRAA